MSKENLTVWSAVEETHPSATKKAIIGGRVETSINGVYMIKRATEIFGMLGIGWGYEIMEERYDKGHAVSFDPEGRESEHMTTHTIKLKLWFLNPNNKEERGEVISYGHTPYVRSTKNGLMTDGEAPKKSLTDAIKKALSSLGFCADIYMGLYDDQEYVQELANQELIEKADDKDEERLRQAQEYADWKERNLEAMRKAVSMNELAGLYKATVRKMQRRDDKSGVLSAERIKDEVKSKLEENQNEAA